jgi:hypothetical protein
MLLTNYIICLNVMIILFVIVLSAKWGKVIRERGIKLSP